MKTLYLFFRGLAADWFDLVTVELYQGHANALHQAVTEKWRLQAKLADASTELMTADSAAKELKATINGLRQSLAEHRRNHDISAKELTRQRDMIEALKADNAILAHQVSHLQGLINHESEKSD